MKRIRPLMILVLLLNACSFSLDALQPAKPTRVPPTPARALSSTPTFTITPTLPTPTFTLTPTLIGYKTPTFTPENTATPTITLTLTDLYSNVTPFTPTPNVALGGFAGVNTSSIAFYKGKGCDPTSVKFTAQTNAKMKAAYVVLFVRLASKSSGAKSEWTSITIPNDGSNIFTHTLLPDEIKAVDNFENPWVQYQFVATSNSGAEVGRTGVFEEFLSLLRCVPTETPTATQTPLKP